jgi:hypothetical protein
MNSERATDEWDGTRQDSGEDCTGTGGTTHHTQSKSQQAAATVSLPSSSLLVLPPFSHGRLLSSALPLRLAGSSVSRAAKLHVGASAIPTAHTRTHGHTRRRGEGTAAGRGKSQARGAADRQRRAQGSQRAPTSRAAAELHSATKQRHNSQHAQGTWIEYSLHLQSPAFRHHEPPVAWWRLCCRRPASLAEAVYGCHWRGMGALSDLCGLHWWRRRGVRVTSLSSGQVPQCLAHDSPRLGRPAASLPSHRRRRAQ